MRILRVRKFQKVLRMVIYVCIQAHFFSVTTGLVSIIQVSIEIVTLVEEHVIGKSIILSLDQIPDIPKSDIGIESCPYSNSCFCLTTGLTSATLMISIERHTLGGDFNIKSPLSIFVSEL